MSVNSSSRSSTPRAHPSLILSRRRCSVWTWLRGARPPPPPPPPLLLPEGRGRRLLANPPPPEPLTPCPLRLRESAVTQKAHVAARLAVCWATALTRAANQNKKPGPPKLEPADSSCKRLHARVSATLAAEPWTALHSCSMAENAAEVPVRVACGVMCRQHAGLPGPEEEKPHGPALVRRRHLGAAAVAVAALRAAQQGAHEVTGVRAGCGPEVAGAAEALLPHARLTERSKDWRALFVHVEGMRADHVREARAHSRSQ